MTAAKIRLTLIFPPALEAPICEALSARQDLPGFTLLHAEGHSSDIAHASAAEQVRGRIQRRVLWMLLDLPQLEIALDAVRAITSSRGVRWWTEPVLASGRLE